MMESGAGFRMKSMSVFRRRRITLGGLFLLAACGGAGNSPQTGGALKKGPLTRLSRIEAGHEAVVTLEPGRGVLSVRVAPQGGAAPLGMARRLDIARPLLEQVFRDQGKSREYLLAAGEYRELNARIARDAACSGKWNLKTGRPFQGDAAGAVKAAIAAGPFDTELREFFGPLGFQVAVDSVEAVVVCPWRQVPLAAEGAVCKPAAASRVPCGASILFRLRPQSQTAN